MEPSIFSFIRRYSWRQQMVILAMTVLSFPFLYASLELPKIIINDALSSDGVHALLNMQFSQVQYLFLLCGVFLVLVLINGAFKYVVNVYKGIVAERMLRRLRYMLYSHVLRFPLPHFRKITQGELVQMINAEVEPLGGYVGDALAVPAFQGGTLLTILIFMFAQDPVLGLAAIVLYPLQIWIIPKLQRQVNELGKARVKQVRKLAEMISETAAGVRDIRANDTTLYERARFSKELGRVFEIRFDIYKKKFFIKFLNNFLAQLGPFFFFSVGGYLVIKGDITIGALVAVLGAHKDLSSPWKELLTHYQLLQDVRIKYEQVVAQFTTAGLRDEDMQTVDPDPSIRLVGPLRANGVTVLDEDSEPLLESVSFSFDLPCHIAVTGPGGSGKEELIMVLANLLQPQRGRILIGDHAVQQLAESVTGRRMALVGNPSFVRSGTIRDNLFYGLMHRPMGELTIAESERRLYERRRLENMLSGNSEHDADVPWIDYEAGSLTPEEEGWMEPVVKALRLAHLDHDVYMMGLRSSIDSSAHPELAARLLEARHAMLERLSGDENLARLVEPFDPERYNTNATVAENLLFGTPVGPEFDIERLAENAYVLETLENCGLMPVMIEVGYKLASTMLELFADLPPDHEYFRQFSFIDAEDLPEYRALIGRVDPATPAKISATDRQRLLALPFKLVQSRHRLGLIDEELQERLLEARHSFRKNLPRRLRDAIAFFDPERYNDAASIQDNVLFGKVVYGQAQAGPKIAALLTETLDELGLATGVMMVGLDTDCGHAGARLSPAQRQKLGIARALLKNADVYLFYDPLGPLDSGEQIQLRDGLLEALAGKTVIWALQNAAWADRFDHVIELDRGRIVAIDGSGDAAPGRDEAQQALAAGS